MITRCFRKSQAAEEVHRSWVPCVVNSFVSASASVLRPCLSLCAARWCSHSLTHSLALSPSTGQLWVKLLITAKCTFKQQIFTSTSRLLDAPLARGIVPCARCRLRICVLNVKNRCTSLRRRMATGNCAFCSCTTCVTSATDAATSRWRECSLSLSVSVSVSLSLMCVHAYVCVRVTGSGLITQYLNPTAQN